MGLDRLPSGSIRGRLMVDDVTCTATFATEAEAREWMVVTRGRAVGMRASRTLTVEDYARRLGEFIDAAANIDRYRRDVEVHIVPALGPRPLGEICAAELETLLEQVSLAVSPADAEQVRRTLRELFTDTVDERLVAASPVPVRGSP